MKQKTYDQIQYVRFCKDIFVRRFFYIQIYGCIWNKKDLMDQRKQKNIIFILFKAFIYNGCKHQLVTDLLNSVLLIQEEAIKAMVKLNYPRLSRQRTKNLNRYQIPAMHYGSISGMLCNDISLRDFMARERDVSL